MRKNGEIGRWGLKLSKTREIPNSNSLSEVLGKSFGELFGEKREIVIEGEVIGIRCRDTGS